jgi:hypothetical protein
MARKSPSTEFETITKILLKLLSCKKLIGLKFRRITDYATLAYNKPRNISYQFFILYFFLCTDYCKKMSMPQAHKRHPPSWFSPRLSDWRIVPWRWLAFWGDDLCQEPCSNPEKEEGDFSKYWLLTTESTCAFHLTKDKVRKPSCQVHIGASDNVLDQEVQNPKVWKYEPVGSILTEMFRQCGNTGSTGRSTGSTTCVGREYSITHGKYSHIPTLRHQVLK